MNAVTQFKRPQYIQCTLYSMLLAQLTIYMTSHQSVQTQKTWRISPWHSTGCIANTHKQQETYTLRRFT